MVGRAILAVAHGVVREDEDRGQLHQRCQPDGGPCVVAKDEEGRAKSPDLGQHKPVHGRRHRVLADAEMQVLPARAVGLEISGAIEFEGGPVRRRQIRRASEKPGDILRDDVKHIARCVPPSHALGVGREDREVSVPPRRKLASLHLIDLGSEIGMLGPIGVEQVCPSAARLRAARPNPGREMLADSVGDEELRILGPPIAPFAQADLLLAERFAMGRGSILLVRRAVADMAIQNDEGRAALCLMEYPEGVLDQIDIVGVADPQYVPPVTQEPRRDVLGEGEFSCCPRW